MNDSKQPSTLTQSSPQTIDKYTAPRESAPDGNHLSNHSIYPSQYQQNNLQTNSLSYQDTYKSFPLCEEEIERLTKLPFLAKIGPDPSHPGHHLDTKDFFNFFPNAAISTRLLPQVIPPRLLATKYNIPKEELISSLFPHTVSLSEEECYTIPDTSPLHRTQSTTTKKGCDCDINSIQHFSSPCDANLSAISRKKKLLSIHRTQSSSTQIKIPSLCPNSNICPLQGKSPSSKLECPSFKMKKIPTHYQRIKGKAIPLFTHLRFFYTYPILATTKFSRIQQQYLYSRPRLMRRRKRGTKQYNLHQLKAAPSPAIPKIHQATLNLTQLYQQCNPFFTFNPEDNPKRSLVEVTEHVLNNGHDNEQNNLLLSVGDVIYNETNEFLSYKVVDTLGQGTFGQVMKCIESPSGMLRAIKIIKLRPAFQHQVWSEVKILGSLNGFYDPTDSKHIVRLLDSFSFKSHICLVFELLSLNLFDLLKQNQFRGLSLSIIRAFGSQILTSLLTMRHANIVHCDLKPENVLLAVPNNTTLKLIDFGSSTLLDTVAKSNYVQSRFYRAPEVILGFNYTTQIDMWSFGCIVAELFLGLPLFPALSQQDLLSRVTQAIGPPPSDLLHRSTETHRFYKITPSLVELDAIAVASIPDINNADEGLNTFKKVEKVVKNYHRSQEYFNLATTQLYRQIGHYMLGTSHFNWFKSYHERVTDDQQLTTKLNKSNRPPKFDPVDLNGNIIHFYRNTSQFAVKLHQHTFFSILKQKLLTLLKQFHPSSRLSYNINALLEHQIVRYEVLPPPSFPTPYNLYQEDHLRLLKERYNALFSQPNLAWVKVQQEYASSASSHLDPTRLPTVLYNSKRLGDEISSELYHQVLKKEHQDLVEQIFSKYQHPQPQPPNAPIQSPFQSQDWLTKPIKDQSSKLNILKGNLLFGKLPQVEEREVIEAQSVHDNNCSVPTTRRSHKNKITTPLHLSPLPVSSTSTPQDKISLELRERVEGNSQLTKELLPLIQQLLQPYFSSQRQSLVDLQALQTDHLRSLFAPSLHAKQQELIQISQTQISQMNPNTKDQRRTQDYWIGWLEDQQRILTSQFHSDLSGSLGELHGIHRAQRDNLHSEQMKLLEIEVAFHATVYYDVVDKIKRGQVDIHDLIQGDLIENQRPPLDYQFRGYNTYGTPLLNTNRGTDIIMKGKLGLYLTDCGQPHSSYSLLLEHEIKKQYQKYQQHYLSANPNPNILSSQINQRQRQEDKIARSSSYALPRTNKHHPKETIRVTAIEYQLHSPATNIPPSRQYLPGKLLSDVIGITPFRVGMEIDEIAIERSTRAKLLHLLLGCLTWFPGRRYTPYIALNHPFFTHKPLYGFDVERYRQEEQIIADPLAKHEHEQITLGGYNKHSIIANIDIKSFIQREMIELRKDKVVVKCYCNVMNHYNGYNKVKKKKNHPDTHIDEIVGTGFSSIISLLDIFDTPADPNHIDKIIQIGKAQGEVDDVENGPLDSETMSIIPPPPYIPEFLRWLQERQYKSYCLRNNLNKNKPFDYSPGYFSEIEKGIKEKAANRLSNHDTNVNKEEHTTMGADSTGCHQNISKLGQDVVFDTLDPDQCPRSTQIPMWSVDQYGLDPIQTTFRGQHQSKRLFESTLDITQDLEHPQRSLYNQIQSQLATNQALYGTKSPIGDGKHRHLLPELHSNQVMMDGSSHDKREIVLEEQSKQNFYRQHNKKDKDLNKENNNNNIDNSFKNKSCDCQTCRNSTDDDNTSTIPYFLSHSENDLPASNDNHHPAQISSEALHHISFNRKYEDKLETNPKTNLITIHASVGLGIPGFTPAHTIPSLILNSNTSSIRDGVDMDQFVLSTESDSDHVFTDCVGDGDDRNNNLSDPLQKILKESNQRFSPIMKSDRSPCPSQDRHTARSTSPQPQPVSQPFKTLPCDEQSKLQTVQLKGSNLSSHQDKINNTMTHNSHQNQNSPPPQQTQPQMVHDHIMALNQTFDSNVFFREMWQQRQLSLCYDQFKQSEERLARFPRTQMGKVRTKYHRNRLTCLQRLALKQQRQFHSRQGQHHIQLQRLRRIHLTMGRLAKALPEEILEYYHLPTPMMIDQKIIEIDLALKNMIPSENQPILGLEIEHDVNNAHEINEWDKMDGEVIKNVELWRGYYFKAHTLSTTPPTIQKKITALRSRANHDVELDLQGLARNYIGIDFINDKTQRLYHPWELDSLNESSSSRLGFETLLHTTASLNAPRYTHDHIRIWSLLISMRMKAIEDSQRPKIIFNNFTVGNFNVATDFTLDFARRAKLFQSKEIYPENLPSDNYPNMLPSNTYDMMTNNETYNPMMHESDGFGADDLPLQKYVWELQQREQQMQMQWELDAQEAEREMERQLCVQRGQEKQKIFDPNSQQLYYQYMQSPPLKGHLNNNDPQMLYHGDFPHIINHPYSHQQEQEDQKFPTTDSLQFQQQQPQQLSPLFHNQFQSLVHDQNVTQKSSSYHNQQQQQVEDGDEDDELHYKIPSKIMCEAESAQIGQDQEELLIKYHNTVLKYQEKFKEVTRYAREQMIRVTSLEENFDETALWTQMDQHHLDVLFKMDFVIQNHYIPNSEKQVKEGEREEQEEVEEREKNDLRDMMSSLLPEQHEVIIAYHTKILQCHQEQVQLYGRYREHSERMDLHQAFIGTPSSVEYDSEFLGTQLAQIKNQGGGRGDDDRNDHDDFIITKQPHQQSQQQSQQQPDHTLIQPFHISTDHQGMLESPKGIDDHPQYPDSQFDNQCNNNQEGQQPQQLFRKMMMEEQQHQQQQFPHNNKDDLFTLPSNICLLYDDNSAKNQNGVCNHVILTTPKMMKLMIPLDLPIADQNDPQNIYNALFSTFLTWFRFYLLTNGVDITHPGITLNVQNYFFETFFLHGTSFPPFHEFFTKTTHVEHPTSPLYNIDTDHSIFDENYSGSSGIVHDHRR